MILINFSLEPVETKVNYEDFFKLYIFQCKSECSIFTYYKLKLIREYKFIKIKIDKVTPYISLSFLELSKK